MKAHGTRLILGLITATVIAVDQQGFHLHSKNKADNYGFAALMESLAAGCLASAPCDGSGRLPHGLWPPPMVSGCTAFENEDTVAVFNTDGVAKWHATTQVGLHRGLSIRLAQRRVEGNRATGATRLVTSLTAVKGCGKSATLVAQLV